jgi:hypothetical protein
MRHQKIRDDYERQSWWATFAETGQLPLTEGERLYLDAARSS